MIGSARVPLSRESRTALLQAVEVECGQIAQSVQDREFAEMRAAETAAETAAARLAQSRAEAVEAATKAGAEHSGNWLKVAIWGLCAAACFAAEFVLTWKALCFVLNVPQMSVLGVLLGLAPPSGLAVLEVFLARLFEDPWQRVRAAAGSSRRTLVNVAMAALLITLATGNVITIVHLAKAREQAGKAARVLANVNSEGDADVDQGAIDNAVLWVSVLVSVDGAIFLLLSLRDATDLRTQRRHARRALETRERVLRLENESDGRRTEAGSRHEAWKGVERKATLAAERYRAHCLCLLAQKETEAALRPVEELVDQSLRLHAIA
jgi:hypothetical protein